MADFLQNPYNVIALFAWPYSANAVFIFWIARRSFVQDFRKASLIVKSNSRNKIVTTVNNLANIKAASGADESVTWENYEICTKDRIVIPLLKNFIAFSFAFWSLSVLLHFPTVPEKIIDLTGSPDQKGLIDFVSVCPASY